jgi:hypothetical protein
MQKELGETLLKIVSGGKLDGASILLMRVEGKIYSLGVLSKSNLNKFLTFNPTIKDKGFVIFREKEILKHVTLTDLSNWHITCRKKEGGKKPRRLNKKTSKISDDFIHWFGISVKNLENLIQVAETGDKKMVFQMDFVGIPPADSNRRLANLTALIQSSLEHSLVTLNDNYKNEEHYYHFEFFICGKKTKVENMGIFSPVIESGVKIPVNVLKLRAVDILDNDIVIVSAQVPGTIKEPVRIWFKQ